MHTISLQYKFACPYPPSFTAQLFGAHFMDDNTSDDNNLQSYTSWLRVWTAHLSGISQDIRVPPEATAVTTPLNIGQWKKSSQTS